MVLRPIFNEIVPLAEMETEWKIRNLDGKLQNYGVIEKKYWPIPSMSFCPISLVFTVFNALLTMQNKIFV